MMSKHTVLIVTRNDSRGLEEALRSSDTQLAVVRTAQEAVRRLGRRQFDAVLIHHERNAVDAIEALLNIRDLDENVPVIALAEAMDAQGELILQEQPGITLTHSVSAARKAVFAALARHAAKGKYGREQAYGNRHTIHAESHPVNRELRARTT